MRWNIAPESISLVFLGIVWAYSRKGSYLPTLKNRVFQGCLMVTFAAMFTNIISTYMIYYCQVLPLWLTAGVTSVYFVLTPLMGLVYFGYVLTSLYPEWSRLNRLVWITVLPGAAYAVFALANPFHGLLFHLSKEEGYAQGRFILVTYFIFYFYCMGCMIATVRMRRDLDRQIYRILLTFPAVALLVILVQQMFPDIILTGSAATCALLTIYLHFQNKQISQDYLTGVPNRQALLDMMAWLMKKKQEGKFVLAVFSLRDFRQINSACGQRRGDRFLKEICNFLCTVGPAGAVYRFNGDEFALLFPTGDEMEIRGCLKAVVRRMEQPWQIDDYRYTLSMAIGLISNTGEQDTLENMISAVEYSVFCAKNDKEKKICYCDQEMRDMMARRQEIVRILRDKLNDQSFEMYYQPIYSVKSGKFLYMESLMRIPDSPIGPIYPSEFIPVAEETGMIIELTYVLLDKVCKLVNHLLASGIEVEACHVNFSAVQFSQPDLAEKVLHIIYENGTPMSAVKIEFTESILAENPEVVTAFAMEMGKHGIVMGLDDFGMGYSNFSSVIRIPFGIIKLDKSLVDAGAVNPTSELAIRNLVRTFHQLGMAVLAEGVETEEQKEMVIDFGVDQIQGYYYSRPLPEAELEVFLRKEQGLEGYNQ